MDGVRAGLLPAPGEEDGTPELGGARLSLGKSSVNSPCPPESWGSP